MTIPEGVASIGRSAFYGCTSLTSVSIPNSVNEIGEYAFQETPWLEQRKEEQGAVYAGRCVIACKKSLASAIIKEGTERLCDYSFSDCKSLISVTIPEGVTEIGREAFCRCTGLTNVTIPKGVTKIGGGAFLGCTGLTSVTIPEEVTEIGWSAFEGCMGLTSVTISENVTSIGKWAFSGCKSLTNVTIPAGVTYINGYVFAGCTGLTNVTIPEGVTKIGEFAFLNCTGLTSVTIPAGVTSIGNNAFSGCKSLDNVTIPARVTNIDWCAFACCAGLTQVTIPERVTKIGDRVFSRCTGLTQITISEGIAEIGRRTFEGCTGLTQVTIPESVTNIGDSAFEGCTALREIILLGKPEIGKEAFPDSELTIVAEQFLMSDFSIPAYKQAAAKGFALRYTAGAELPEEYRADCLKYIKSQKKKLYPIALEFTPLLHVMLVEKMVPKGSFMELMDQASAHGNAEAFAMLLDYQNKQFEQGELKKLVERKMQQEMESLITGVLTATEAKKEWKYEKNLKGGICLLDYKGSETDVVVPTAIGKDHVTAIGSYAFSPTRSRLTAVRAEQRRQITTVRLSETVTQIGDYAFSSCIGLTDIAMPDSVTKIGERAFSNCQTLTSITIPKRVTNIGKNAFQDCPNLVIHAPVGSYAEQYAKKNSIPFQTMEE